jgi:hypothetical protein
MALDLGKLLKQISKALAIAGAVLAALTAAIQGNSD